MPVTVTHSIASRIGHAVAVVAACLTVLLLLNVDSASAKPGDLDTTFGTGGFSITPINSSTDSSISSVIALPNGKLLAAGFTLDPVSNYDFVVARYNSNGTLDTTFGAAGTGIVTTPIGSGEDRAFSAVALSSGKIVLGGYANVGGAADFTLVRYNEDGTLDTTFGPNQTGIVTTQVGSSNDFGYHLISLPNNKLLLAGSSFKPGIGTDFALARYNEDGTLDTTFGPNQTGTVTTQVGTLTNAVSDVSHLSSGKLVAVGYAVDSGGKYDFALVRYNEDGTLDTTFGPNQTGKVKTPVGTGDDFAYSSLVLPNEKIVAVGDAQNVGTGYDFGAVRYNSDGTLDTTFGPNQTGKVTTDIGNNNNYASSAILTAAEKIVVGGSAFPVDKAELALARYNADGSLDTSFGSGGIVTTGNGNEGNSIRSLAALPNGNIVAAGRTAISATTTTFMLARYKTSEDPPPPSPPTDNNGGGSSGGVTPTPSGGATTPTTTTNTIGKLVVSKKQRKVTLKGQAAIKVACPQSAKKPCKGVLKLTAKLGKQTATVATKPFTVTPGKQAGITVKLTKKALKALKKVKKLKVVAVAQSSDVTAAITSAKTGITLVLAKK